MSMLPLGGLVGSLAGSPLAQTRGGAVEQQQAADVAQQRLQEAAQKADAAAGIGTTQEDAQTSERDADGRRLWEAETKKRTAASDDTARPQSPPRAKDPTGQSGGKLDLSG